MSPMYGGDNSIHLTMKLAPEMSQIKIQTVKDAIAAPVSDCIDFHCQRPFQPSPRSLGLSR